MLYEKVKEATLLAQNNNPGANFYIPLEDFMEFVTYHLIAFIKMRNPISSKKMSMNQYLRHDEAYSTSYKKVVITDEEEYKIFHNTLRNAINRFNALNHKTKAEAEIRKQAESEKGSRGNRFETPITIHDFQVIGEMPTLMDLKATKDPLNTVYQRILKNNIHNITFTNYKLFSEHLNDSITEQNLTMDEKQLHHYLIEKHLKLHTLKSICKEYENMVQSKNLSLTDEERKARLQLLLYATNMPMVQQWKTYIDLVKELPPYKFHAFIQEIDSITNFIKWILLMYFQQNEDVVFDEQDLIYFNSYVDPKRFENDFVLRRDFSSQTFSIVMDEIKQGNEKDK
ncbi:hypothetical protein AJ85_17070 [Alkalihalobacillus alcalophilus ATCC 27647 = CGMCC 1.3604]|nr:hypothetical protein [Alkalihalobacillus alcalophilus]MED1561529.1 hypothetical protein [Alkalihalobacillus alcalophilus]THG89538.1 hypothetical protein AJ85_17070 [Alkalihalobacillus alcalophilus ATCC 27647 = CGMCC 1.3604]